MYKQYCICFYPNALAHTFSYAFVYTLAFDLAYIFACILAFTWAYTVAFTQRYSIICNFNFQQEQILKKKHIFEQINILNNSFHRAYNRPNNQKYFDV